MFFRQTPKFVSLKRFFSSSTAQSSAVKAVSGTVEKVAGYAQPLIYYTRVSTSFLSQVASHQKLLSFPDVAKGIEGISNFVKGLTNGAWKNVTVGQVGSFGIEGIKIYGLFLIGEIIGRGSFVGYDIQGAGHDHGHH